MRLHPARLFLFFCILGAMLHLVYRQHYPLPSVPTRTLTPAEIAADEAYEAEVKAKLESRVINASGERVVPILHEGAPLWELCQIIDSETTVQQFTMEWSDNVFSWHRKATANYNRQSGTLTERLNDVGEAIPSQHTTNIYTGVTDAIIHRLKDDPDSQNDHGLTFENLKKYGCPQTTQTTTDPT